MIKDDCIFCKLANGVIPTNTVYEDEDFRVIMDAAPATKGHCLILPKQHFDNLEQIDDEVSAKVFPLAKKMYALLKDKLGCEGFNVMQNNEAVAGQTVFHFHVHLIPRYTNDGQKLDFNPNMVTEEQIEEVKKVLVK